MQKPRQSNPRFTVVIPTLNEEAHLPRLLTDLSRQTFKNFEVIVVDAKSNDKTREIAKKYKANVLISNKKNVSFQRNAGAKKGSSEWIVFMDADNRIPKNYLQKVDKYLETNGPDILSTWLTPDNGSKKDKLTANIMNVFMEIYKNTKKPYVMESMIFIKRDSFKAIGGFDIKIPWREGEDLLKRGIQMGMKYEFIKTPKYAYSFRRFKKLGAYGMLQDTAQMEIIKLMKGTLPKKEAEILYPMKGGGFYIDGKKQKLTLQKFISILFQDKTVNAGSVKLFKKSFDSWKSLFG